MLHTILIVFAFVLFILAGVNAQSPHPRMNFIGLGLACWVATLLF